MSHEERLAVFSRMVETMGGQVMRVDSVNDIGPSLVEALRPLGNRVALVDSPMVIASNLENHLARGGFAIEKEGADFAREADIGIVEFEYGIAETGTVAMDATDLKARLAAMLVLKSIVLLPEDKVLETFNDVVESYLAGSAWPTYLTCVTGPSRTADIERSLTIGVHGPEQLLIILVGNGGGNNGR